MPAPLTPVPASAGYVYNEPFDTPEQRFMQLYPGATTASVVQYTALSSSAAAPVVYKTTYSWANIVSSAVNTNGVSLTILTQVYSAPIVYKDFTQSFRVMTSNTTVWNSQNSPSSLLLTAGGTNDAVRQRVAVVSDSIT